MAIIYSNYAFDLRSFDLSILVDNYYSDTFNDDIDYAYEGVTYADTYEIMTLDDYYETYTFAGSAFSDSGTAVTGTATAMMGAIYDGDEWLDIFWATSISIALSDITDASLTSSTTDDYALFNAEFTGADSFYLSGYADYVDGRDGNDAIYGYAGADTLVGNTGADTLTGGAGKDALSGGAGNDRFIFGSASESSKTAATADKISDFSRGADKINLSGIDAFTTSGTNDTFVWKGTAAFDSTSKGEVRYEKFDNRGTSNDYTMVWIDTDADTDVEMAIRLTGLYSLTSSDFFL